jgi:hypothetical protein
MRWVTCVAAPILLANVEQQGVPFNQIEEHYDALERRMLDAFFTHVGSHRGLKYLHWNMREELNQATRFSDRPQEAQAFENRNFVSLHQSTLRKVDVIANIAERAHDRNLKTNTTWWEMHGGRLRTVLAWFTENKLIAFAASLATFIGLGIAIYTLR